MVVLREYPVPSLIRPPVGGYFIDLEFSRYALPYLGELDIRSSDLCGYNVRCIKVYFPFCDCYGMAAHLLKAADPVAFAHSGTARQYVPMVLQS